MAKKILSVIAIGQGGENLVKFACWINENDRASGRGGTGCVGGSKNLKAIVIKAEKKIVKAANRDAWKPAHERALKGIMAEENITSPRKGGLSVYGTNVLTNITSNIGALPTKNSTLTSFGEDAEKISGEYVEAEHPGRRPHLPRLPGGLQEGSRRSRKARGRACTWRASSTSRPGRWAPTWATTT